MKNNLPKISIITAVKNGDKFLEKTINKIINQQMIEIEYIIIDGGSTDQTLNIIKKYDNYIHYWQSGNDKNISDAFNKGLKIASGDFINFQGDGDGFLDENSVYNLFKDISYKDYGLVCGRIQRVSETDNVLFTSPYIKNFNKRSLLRKLTLPHQGLFTHKNLFESYGGFDLNVKYGMDYDHLLRMYSNFPKLYFKNQIVAIWRDDGHGTNKEFKILKEYYHIKRKNTNVSNTVLYLIYLWDLTKQILKKILNK